ncbi:hypothetical protein BCV70DRAFT_19064 [Testicularia cyperi]|uniref:Uncharacterized protein n=1 Tax=Testicularia cyperi TaxID=1882483 RepID=A0A317Y054_9BASI|nr:hypothetical protein BCV70DRAFT_19064 [Testicularia cyperi]
MKGCRTSAVPKYGASVGVFGSAPVLVSLARCSVCFGAHPLFWLLNEIGGPTAESSFFYRLTLLSRPPRLLCRLRETTNRASTPSQGSDATNRHSSGRSCSSSDICAALP